MSATAMNVEHFSLTQLKGAYEEICNEYRRRLNEQWQLDIKDSWWIPSDRIGMTLALCDLEYSLGMEDVRLFVELETPYEDFNEWWNHCLGDTKYHINAYNYFVNGCRPKDLEYGEHKKGKESVEA